MSHLSEYSKHSTSLCISCVLSNTHYLAPRTGLAVTEPTWAPSPSATGSDIYTASEPAAAPRPREAPERAVALPPAATPGPAFGCATTLATKWTFLVP